MHVAFVTPEFVKDNRLYPGGLSTYIHVTSKALTRLGKRVTVYMMSDRDHKSFFDGIPVVEVAVRSPTIIKPLGWLFAKRLPGAVSRIIGSWCVNRRITMDRRNDRIDIIQYTNWKSTGLFRLRDGSLIRISSYDRLWDNNPADRNTDKRLCAWLEELAYKRFETVIGPGSHIAEVIKNDLRLKNEVKIVPSPVELSSKPSRRNFGRDGLRMVMYAGTVSRIKGSSLLLDILREYLDRYSDTVFVIAGKTGSENGVSCGPELSRLASKHPALLQYHPHLEKPDLLAAYGQSDLVIIPSLVDNFPNTALEAASQGAMILASDTASLEPFLSNGRNSIVLQSRGTEDWIKAIRSILEMAPASLTLMKEELKESLKAHQADVAVGRLCEVYEGILTRKGG